MTRRLFFLFAALSLFCVTVTAKAQKGFAVVVDSATHAACQSAIDAYEGLLTSEGFTVTTLAQTWDRPEAIREVLLEMYRNDGLEGAIFVGDIPIPMVRDAQHLTSAFKMDQEQFPFRDSSVPSDRFYDDFDLAFDYLGQDENDPLFHYYSLRYDSPQFIKSDIYTGRLKPTREGDEGYRQINDYFAKLLWERLRENRLDVITTYTGEGSFSNSLTAWRDHCFLMSEHFRDAFTDKNAVKFLFYDMYPFMKELVIEELRRPEMDLMLFHEHGTPDRQYLTTMPKGKSTDEYRDAARLVFRQQLKRLKSPEERQQRMEEWMQHYRVDSLWFEGALTPEQLEKDSLEALRTGIVLEDIPLIAPNARVVIFDACYNGDFREDRYIAGEYIFSGGNTLVTFGNSVNVLQDKNSTDLLGMLAMGFSVGEWAREINILESHIIGDPTFRFSGEEASRINLNTTQGDYWLSLYDNEQHPDLKGLALNKLFYLEYDALPGLLVDAYQTSPSYAVRWQAFHLLQHYRGDAFTDVLEQAIYDPYEFIRRKAVFSMGRVGNDRYIPAIASVYLNDYLDERVHFNSTFTFDLVDAQKLEAEVKRQLGENSSFPDKEAVWNRFKGLIDSRGRIASMADAVTDKEKSLKARLSATRMLRNYAYHRGVPEYLKVITDPGEEEALRIALAEALGWFTLSYQRDAIAVTFKEVADNPDTPEKVKSELLKSLARLKVYTR